MKKILTLFLVLCTMFGINAQSFTGSYALVSTYCPQTNTSNYGMNSMWIEFYDTYIIAFPYGKLFRSAINLDGSSTYMPVGNAGNASLGQLEAIVVSSDKSQVQEYLVSTNLGLTLNMIESFKFIGEGKEPFETYMQSLLNSSQGDSGYEGGRSSRRSQRGASTCSACGGTGVDPTPNSGGSRVSWRAYYNPNGTRCPYCGGYTEHWHNKCLECNHPRY